MISKSKWYISAEGKLMREGWSNCDHLFNVVHLDDHKLFRNGMIEHCFKPFYPNIKITEIDNGDKAYDLIISAIKNKENIDLFISDIIHPGIPGHELVMKIREYESLNNIQHSIPIILLSFLSPTNFNKLQNMRYFKFDRYLAKNSSAEDIAECMDELLFK